MDINHREFIIPCQRVFHLCLSFLFLSCVLLLVVCNRRPVVVMNWVVFLFLDVHSSHKESEEEFLDDHVAVWRSGRGPYVRVSMGFMGVCITLGRWCLDLVGSRNNRRRSVKVNRQGWGTSPTLGRGSRCESQTAAWVEMVFWKNLMQKSTLSGLQL